MNPEKHHTPSDSDALPDMKPFSEKGERLHPEKTIGAFLREERKKKDLSYEQASEMTKIRVNILEALENESWSDLPSPAFASGFVRSYGRALGLEEKKLMEVFNKSRPTAVYTPKPLVEPSRSKKSIVFILIFLLLTLGSAYFFWKGYITHKIVVSHPIEITPSENEPEKAEPIQESHHESVPSAGQIQLYSAPEAVSEVSAAGPIYSPLEEDEASIEYATTVPASDELADQELSLKAVIRETTWLRIFVDDQDPKEYVFRPNEHFEWTAKKGFELLIGNASGIDLEFNGKGVQDIGTPGQVVRLRLPEDFERRPLTD